MNFFTAFCIAHFITSTDDDTNTPNRKRKSTGSDLISTLSVLTTCIVSLSVPFFMFWAVYNWKTILDYRIVAASLNEHSLIYWVYHFDTWWYSLLGLIFFAPLFYMPEKFKTSTFLFKILIILVNLFVIAASTNYISTLSVDLLNHLWVTIDYNDDLDGNSYLSVAFFFIKQVFIFIGTHMAHFFIIESALKIIYAFGIHLKQFINPHTVENNHD